MPFRLCNAPATFQRLMGKVLSGLKWYSCLVYIDDIVVVGDSFENHLYNLVGVLKRLREAGLKVKPSKCSLCQKEVRYIGHVVSAEGISTDPTKVEAICNWPTPTCKQEIQRFLGLANYYRRFIKNFSSIAKPLQRLTEKIMFSTGMSCVRVPLMSFADVLFPLQSWHTLTIQNVLP